MGFNGLEVGAEGPFSSKSKASYLVNYRYSLFSLLKAVGYQIAGTPEYQDFTAKVDVPVGPRGTFSAWTLAGRSKITFLGRDIDSTRADAYGDENLNGRPKFSTGIAAASYEHRFTDHTVARLVVSGSRGQQHYRQDTVRYAAGSRRVVAETPNYTVDLTQDKLSANLSVVHKRSARDQVSAGLIVDLLRYDYYTAALYPVARLERDATGTTALSQLYAQWKHRFSDALTLNAGLNTSRFALNGSTVVEPRAGLRYQASAASSLSLAYGLHSTLQPLLTYFTLTPQPDGRPAQTNRDLGFTRSHHLVLAYDRQLSDNLRLRLETYHQWLFDAPVESTPSYYSNLTEGVDFNTPTKGNLVNGGTGRNYGLELTLERSFARGYYFLLTGSLFDSKYRGSDGVTRNTPFNTRYAGNALFGREFSLGQRANTFTVSLRAATTGGRYETPINLEASGTAGRAMYDYRRAYSQQLAPYFRADVKLGYKINRARLTHEIAFDLQNVTRQSEHLPAGLQPAYEPHRHGVSAGLPARAILPANVLRFAAAILNWTGIFKWPATCASPYLTPKPLSEKGEGD